MSEVSRQALIDRLNAGETQFSDMDFSGLDLSGLNISGCNFHACNFQNCNLTGVVASDVDVSCADFTGAILDNLFAERIGMYKTPRNVAASMENATLVPDTAIEDMQI